MQVSFSHVGTGGAGKTPPLSLGTWPTEGKGYEEALSWYDKVQRTLEPLRGKVGSDDERVQKIKLQCQQAAKAACAQADPAKVCLVRNVLCSAYPQPTLSLPSHAFLLGRLVALLLLAFRVIAPSIASMAAAAGPPWTQRQRANAAPHPGAAATVELGMTTRKVATPAGP